MKRFETAVLSGRCSYCKTRYEPGDHIFVVRGESWRMVYGECCPDQVTALNRGRVDPEYKQPPSSFLLAPNPAPTFTSMSSPVVIPDFKQRAAKDHD